MVSTHTWIETFTGKHVDIIDPQPESIDIIDIAHALSMCNRFGGHTSAPYSVAEHCVRMSHIVPLELALEALLHDAAEAYLGDMPSPFKKAMPEFKAYEARMEAAIRKHFGLPGDRHPDEIKYFDDQLLVTEARDLGLSWWNTGKHTGMPEPLVKNIVPMAWWRAESVFLDRYQALTGVKV